jgi:phosphatidylethanolamine N-methyltransferase
MDQGLSTGAHQDIDGLRERNLRVDSTVGREALTAAAEVEIKDGKKQKTFGRTPDGTGKLIMC